MKKKAPKPKPAPPAPSRLGVALVAAVIVAAGLIVYWNSLDAPFSFDDVGAIVENQTIRNLWPVSDVLFSTRDIVTVEARPLLNLSFAINYAFGMLHVRGYHAVNVAVHILAGLTLFGLIRRTLLLPRFRERMGGRALMLAGVTALIWVVHPLQTESVTYVVQRAESLLGLFYLLTLYLAARGFTAEKPGGWHLAAVMSCALGMATKEVMVSAPLVVLLFDWLFISGNLGLAWKQRRTFYAALALTWIVLLACLLQTGGHRTSAGFGQGMAWQDYAMTQFGAILHYLRLSFWPQPLVLDYGTDVVTAPAEVIPSALAVAILVIGTLIGLRRNPWAGFLGVAFFAILAPSSSVVPIATQTMAEHRMYLPLACVLILIVIGSHELWQRLSARLFTSVQTRTILSAAVPATFAVGLPLFLGFQSIQRNTDYRSVLAIWQDTAAKRPANARSRANLGMALNDEHRLEEAVVEYTEALELSPTNYQAHNGLGLTYYEMGRVNEAIDEYHQSLAINPGYDRAQNNLGYALQEQGQIDEAIACYRKALEVNPGYAKAHNNLGNAFYKRGQLDEAIEQIETALKLDPENVIALNNLGNALFQKGRTNDAIAQYQRALELKPDYVSAANNLGQAMLRQGQVRQAVAQFEKVLAAKPDQTGTLNKLAWVLATNPEASVRNGARAVQLAEQAVKLSSGNIKMVETLAAAYAEAGRFSEALNAARQAQAVARKQTSPLADEFTAQIACYEKNQPFRDLRVGTGPAQGSESSNRPLLDETKSDNPQ